MDATAQAELVRSGEASPAELVEDAIARVEEVNPQLNAVIHELFEEGRAEAAGELPDGPFKGVPFLFKDLGAAYAGQPLHLGMQALKEADFRAPVDTYLARALPRRRLRRDRQDQHPRARDPADHRARRLRAEPQPLEPRAHDRRLVRRLRRRGRLRHGRRSRTPTTAAARSGSRPRINGLVGLKPTRQRTTEGPLIGDKMTGLTVELARHALGPRHRRDPRRGPGPGAGRPLRRAAARCARTSRSSTAESALRIGVLEDPPVRGPRLAPRVRRGGPRDARRLLEGLGHEVDDSSPVDAQDGRGARPRGHVPHPLGGGPGGDPRPVRDAARPRDHRRRRRAADLGAGRGGARAHRGRYLHRPRPAPARRPGDRRLVRERLRPAADADDGRAAGAARHLRPAPATIRWTPSGARSRRARSRRSSTPPASRRSRCRCTGPRTGCRSACSSWRRSAARTC